MSVAETFLRGGRPSITAETLPKTLTTHYDSWCWVTVFPRQWHHDVRVNVITAPSFHLLFGFNRDTDDAAAGNDAAAVDRFHLLYANVQSEGGKPEETLAVIRTVFQQCAPELHPTSFSHVTCVEGDTHDRLGLCSAVSAAWLCERMAEKLLDPSVAATPSSGHVLYTARVKSFVAAFVRLPHGGAAAHADPNAAVCVWQHRFHKQSDGSPLSHELGFLGPAFHALTLQSVVWLRTQSGVAGTADASLPPQGDNRELLETLLNVNPLLWRTRYVEEGHAKAMEVPPAAGTTAPGPSTVAAATKAAGDVGALTGVAKLLAERDAAREAWRAAIGECTTFAVAEPTTASTTAEPRCGDDEHDFRYAFLLQRPHGVKKPIDMDNRDPGPLVPQPIGAEIHLLPDPGDALHALQQVRGEAGSMEFVYEDLLFDEGEVLLQLGPIEGIAFDDIDRLFAFVDTKGSLEQSLNPYASRPVLCTGSCTGIVYPRVVFRKPTGSTEKLNPMTKSHAQVAVSTATPRMLAQAVEALRTLSAHVTALAHPDPSHGASIPSGNPGYTLTGLTAIDAAVLGPASRRCGWCMRRRERLLRCGACKTVYYCSKAHRMLDWKEGAHRSDCALLTAGQALSQEVFEPLATAMGEEEKKARTPGWACGGTLVDFLREERLVTPLTPNAAPEKQKVSSSASASEYPQVHVIGMEGEWVFDAAKRIAQLFSAPKAGEQGTLHVTPVASQLRLIMFVDVPQSNGKENGAPQPPAVPSVPVYANNTILALGYRTGSASEVAVVEVPATGIIGDIWHVKGVSAQADAASLASSAEPSVNAFAAARTAPVLMRVCNTSYFRFVEGEGGSHGRLDDLSAVMYCGPKSGAGLGYLYGSVDTVARLAIGRVPVRVVDSAFIGTQHSAGALLARLDERTDAAGVAARTHLNRRWSAMVPKKGKPGAAGTGDGQPTSQPISSDTWSNSLARLNVVHFGIRSATDSEDTARFPLCIFFDVPVPSTKSSQDSS